MKMALRLYSRWCAVIVAAGVRRRLGDVLRASLRRDVLEHDLQRREVAAQRLHQRDR